MALTAINGGVMASVIFLIYVAQKRLESRTNRYDMASIMLNEVNRIVSIETNGVKSSLKHAEYPIRINIPTNSMHEIIPTNDVYKGILYSGSIKYFKNELQRKLVELYNKFNDDSLTPDKELCVYIIEDLETIMEKNKRYRSMLGL